MDERRIRAALRQARLDYLLDINDELPVQLRVWLDLLSESPRNLTALRDEDEALQKHVIEPLVGWRRLIAADIAVPHGPMIDIGSGNGAPGLPIALAEPSRAAVLLDSRSGAAEFLERVVASLDLGRVSVTCERAEHAGHGPQRERIALAVSRAAAPPLAAIELMLPMLQIGGVGVLWTGALAADERIRCERLADVLGGVITPIEPGEGVSLLVVTKRSPSDPRFPRRWSQIRRGPPPVSSLCANA